MNIGTPELVIMLVVILLLFGGAKLPKLAKSLGQAQREFREGLQDFPSTQHSGGDPSSTDTNRS